MYIFIYLYIIILFQRILVESSPGSRYSHLLGSIIKGTDK